MNAVNWCVALVTAIGSVAVCGAAPAAHPDAHSRTRRQTKQDYFVDILVLADYSLYRQWYDRSQAIGTLTRDQVAQNDMRRYLTLVVSEVSLQYSRLQTTFRLNIRPVGFYIQSWTISSSPWVRLQNASLVNAEPLLSELVTWLLSQTSLPQYDHAMLFTGCDLTTETASGHTTGRATVGTLCQGDRTRSVSVIEDNGAFQSVRTVVHELGHSLNATHDGTTANACIASDNFIMAPGFMNETTANKRNPWFFSACTGQEIQSFVNNIISNAANRQCLENSFTPQSVPDVTGVVPGQLYGPNDMCKHLYGPESSYCYGGNLSNICTYMPCRSGLKCYVHFAATGTICGNKQWCQAGECVGSIDAPSLDDCQFGDQKVLVNGLTCAEMAASSPQLCYDEYTRAVCCQSCQSKRLSGKPGCPYGDRKGSCSSAVCKRIEPNGYMYATDCCGTCDFDPTSWTCADQPQVDGMTCADAVRRQGFQGCYDTSLAYACCATCSRQRNLARPQGCEYGNLLLTGCGKSSTARVSNCDAETCCETCSTVTGTGNTHHVTLPVVAVVFLYNFWVLLYAPFST